MDEKNQTTEKALIVRMKKGEARAIDAFYASYYEVFLRVAIRLTGDFHSAQELAHDAVLKVIEGAGKYEASKGSPRSWFMTVLSNTVKDWARRMKLRWATSLTDDGSGDQHAIDVPDRAPTAHERAEAQEKIAAVQAALMMLAGEDRALIVLRDFEGLSAPEAAAVLGVTTELLGSRLFRARKRLREVLETNWPDLFVSRER